jgi:septal ring factor EnvC (AmiA/AmiB activator)
MFLQEICTKQEKQLKELKSKLASLTSSYKELVGKIKVFANLNIELPSKISELEASANTTPEASPRT